MDKKSKVRIERDTSGQESSYVLEMFCYITRICVIYPSVMATATTTTFHMACKFITSTPLNYQNLPPSSQIILPLYNLHSNSLNNLQSTTITCRRRVSPVYNAVKAEESLQYKTSAPASSKLVLVIGASGGVGIHL